MENNGIRVTCRAADSLPIDQILEFQGELKKISKDNLDKLKRSILKHGFTAPLFVWSDAGDYRLLDGHQRLKALLSLRQEGYDLPMLPVVYIEAESEQEAKEKLLYITSQYGEFTENGFAEFVFDTDFSIDDIRLTDGEFDISFYDETTTANNNSNNTEIDVNDFDDIMEFKLKYVSSVYWEIIRKLSSMDGSPEEVIRGLVLDE
jgi:hypothetical protein